MDATGLAVDLSTELRRREISAEELLEAVIQRTEQISTVLNPIAVKLYDRARRTAKIADKRLANGTGGSLCGLPVTIKDSQWLAGVPCANGSKSLKDFVPDRTSAAVASLEQAGAVIFAKTTCPEFSLVGITDSELYGRTSNPWNLGRTPGGSSGGAGVAVATGLGPLSLGGDGGGSIRIPAAFCGVVGFKPSFGHIDREPCFPAWKSLVCYGPMARTVADARLMLSALAQTTTNFTKSKPRAENLTGLRLIVSEDLGFAPIDTDVRDRFRRLVDILANAGAELLYDDPGLPSSVETWGTTAAYDAWKHHQESPNQAGVGEIARLFLEFGAQFTNSEFRAAQQQRHRISHAYARLFERTGARVLLTPTVGCEAFPHDRVFPERIDNTSIELPWIDWAGFLYDANLTGMPSCVLPMGIGDDGLPVSVQLVGPTGTDIEVLDVAEQLESLVNWHHRYANGTDHAAFQEML